MTGVKVVYEGVIFAMREIDSGDLHLSIGSDDISDILGDWHGKTIRLTIQAIGDRP